jgi:hypothetical protein
MIGYSAVEFINARNPVEPVKKETGSDEEDVKEGEKNKAYEDDTIDF